MNTLLEQLKKRRLALGMKQKDMLLRVGVSRQQYQQIESKGNPRLSTLELIVNGLNSELMLIPKEKLSLIKEILENEAITYPIQNRESIDKIEEDSFEKNPWKDLLKDLE